MAKYEIIARQVITQQSNKILIKLIDNLIDEGMIYLGKINQTGAKKAEWEVVLIKIRDFFFLMRAGSSLSFAICYFMEIMFLLFVEKKKNSKPRMCL